MKPSWCLILISLSWCGAWAKGSDEAVVYLGAAGAGSTFSCNSVQAADCQIAASWDELGAIVARYATRGVTKSGARLSTLKVLIGPGVIRVDHALKIDGWGNSSNPPMLIIRGDAHGSVISGSVNVPKDQWQPAPQSGPQSQSAALHTRVVNYAKIVGRRAASVGVREAFGRELRPLPIDIFQGEQRMTLARWPNDHYATIKTVSPSDGGRIAIELEGSGFRGIPPDGALLSGYLANDWAYERVPVKPDSAGSGALSLANGDLSLGIKPHQRVMIENSLVELDSPGEWYFDADSQDIYFWPREAAAGAADDLELALCDLFLGISNSHNVHIDGLTLRDGLGEAIAIDRSSDVSIDHLTVKNVANLAVHISGGENVAVRNCRIEDVGAGGIHVYGGDRMTLRPGKVSVDHCLIQRFAQRIKTYQPAIRLEGVGNSATSNYIRESPHVGIIFNGNDQLIEANHLENVVTEGDDSGAIYTGRDWTARGSIVRNNMVSNVQGMEGAHQAVGLYLDDQASGVLADKNIFVNVMMGVLVGGGSDNVIQDNIFVNNRSSIAFDARGVTWQAKDTQDHGGTLWKNLTKIPVDSAPYRKYPHLADLRQRNPGVPEHNEFHGNVFIASGGIGGHDANYFAWKDSENIARGMDALAKRGPESSPEYFDLITSRLPSGWRVQYPARGNIPR